VAQKVCRYVRYGEKTYNVMVNGKWHSTHYTLDTSIKEAVRIKKKDPSKSVVVIKNMGYVECRNKEEWDYY